MNNSKNGKMYVGIIINAVTSLIGLILWLAVGENSVKMKSDFKTYVPVLFACVIIPSIVLYVIWYLKGVKALASATDKIPSFIPFFAISLIAILALTVLPTLLVHELSKALTYAAIAAVASVIGSLVSYLTCQP